MKKYLVLVLMILLPLGVAGLAALVYFLGWSKALLWSPAVLVPVAAVVIRRIWKHRRARMVVPEHVQEHRPGSMHYQALVHLDVPVQKLARLCNMALRLKAGRDSESPNHDGEFTALTPFNWRTWGQRITMHAENRGGEMVVQIESRPRFSFSPPDQGENAANVRDCFEYFKRYERALAVGID